MTAMTVKQNIGTTDQCGSRSLSSLSKIGFCGGGGPPLNPSPANNIATMNDVINAILILPNE
jgi:hypothetical protein